MPLGELPLLRLGAVGADVREETVARPAHDLRLGRSGGQVLDAVERRAPRHVVLVQDEVLRLRSPSGAATVGGEVAEVSEALVAPAHEHLA